jgi:hypothetical protein
MMVVFKALYELECRFSVLKWQVIPRWSGKVASSERPQEVASCVRLPPHK